MEACLIRDHTELGLGFRQWIPTGEQSGIADAHRDGKRFIVRADEKLTASHELESAIHAGSG
jgi:hypothetical protein